MGSIMNGGGGGTLISGAGTLINVKNVGKTMTCPHAQSRAQQARPAPRKRRLKGWRLSTSRYSTVLFCTGTGTVPGIPFKDTGGSRDTHCTGTGTGTVL